MKLIKSIISVVLLIVVTICCYGCNCDNTVKDQSKKQIKSVTIFDTDVGTDDAFAIMLLSQMNVPVDYIVATQGNADAKQVVKNAIILKTYLKMDNVTIVSGMPANVVNQGEKDTFHGKDGLANISEKMEKDLNLTNDQFTNFITFDELSKNLKTADEITYVSVGPVTNLAAMLKDRVLQSKIKRIYLMGGGIQEFNCDHNTEFNFSKNPQAVKEVLSSGLDITLFPLDLTNHHVISDEQITELKELDVFPEYIIFLEHNKKMNLKYNEIPDVVLHDCMPVLYMANQNDFILEDMKLISDSYGSISKNDNGSCIHVATKAKNGLLMDSIEMIFKKKSIEKN